MYLDLKPLMSEKEDLINTLCGNCRHYRRQCELCRLHQLKNLMYYVYERGMHVENALRLVERQLDNTIKWINERYDARHGLHVGEG